MAGSPEAGEQPDNDLRGHARLGLLAIFRGKLRVAVRLLVVEITPTGNRDAGKFAADAIFDALNIIYDEAEKRSLIWLNVVSLFFTICAIAGIGLAIALVVVFRPRCSPGISAICPIQTGRDARIRRRAPGTNLDWNISSFGLREFCSAYSGQLAV